MSFRKTALAGLLIAGGLAAMSASAGVRSVDGHLAAPPGDMVHPVVSVDRMPYHMQVPFMRALQDELARHGYDPGPSDGVYGYRTQAAIRQYQYDARLPVDGIASEELMNHLRYAQPRVMARPYARQPRPSPAPAPGLGRLVLDVQRGLRARGYYGGPLDGVYGPETQRAVRRFQRDAGLPVTGNVDPVLRDVLLRGGPGPGPRPYVPQYQPPPPPGPVFIPPPGCR